MYYLKDLSPKQLFLSPNLASKLDKYALSCTVISLSLYYEYYFSYCTQKVAGCVPLPIPDHLIYSKPLQYLQIIIMWLLATQSQPI